MRRFFAVAVAFFIAIGCTPKSDFKTLKIKGSESMHEPFEALKRAFEARQDSIKIVLEGGGSRTGLMSIQNEEVDIGLSSYNFDVNAILGSDHNVKEQIVAYDGIVLINNERNPISELTDEQISGIFSGEYNDWSQLGGEPGKIKPIIRDQNSGTQKFFTEHFKINQVSNSALVAKENHEIVSRVHEDKHGIGFIGYAYVTFNVKDISITSLINEDDTFFVFPSQRSIQEGSYPLKRGLRIYYQKSPNTRVMAFLSFMQSDLGKEILEQQGLISVAPNQLATE